MLNIEQYWFVVIASDDLVIVRNRNMNGLGVLVVEYT